MNISVCESVYTDIDFKLVYNCNYTFSTCVVLITILMDLHFEILYADLILTWPTGISVLKLVNIQYRSISFITTKLTNILPLSENIHSTVSLQQIYNLQNSSYSTTSVKVCQFFFFFVSK